MITGALLLAFAGWAFTFAVPWGNFWVKIGLTVIVVCSYSLIFRRPTFRFSVKGLFWGVGSAAALYGIFFVGHVLSPYVIPGAHTQVGNIYDLGTGSLPTLVFLLLFSITGPGEEIFWRGFLQEELQRRLGERSGAVLAIALYGGVHVFSLNPMLICAALTAGAFWGLLYLWKRDLFMLVVSHSLWSAVIFTILPIR